MISLSQNHSHGPIPRSLVNCVMLEILDLGNNHINDVFPSWISILLELRVLILQSNGFHGIIEKPETNFGFPKLRVIDLSNNNFIGKLPLEYFQIWKGMESFGVDRATAYAGSDLYKQWLGILVHVFNGTDKQRHKEGILENPRFLRGHGSLKQQQV